MLRIVPEGAAYCYVLKSTTEELSKLAIQGFFIGEQCVIDRAIRDIQFTTSDRSSALS